jgi:iron complex transport system substrate-binding protein
VTVRSTWLVFAGATALAGAAAAVTMGPIMRPIHGALVGARGFQDTVIEGRAFPRRAIGPSGQARIIREPPRRIVSVYLASDELLAELVDPGRLAAVSIFADDASSSNCLGAFPPPIARVRGEAEEILALRPDLIFVTNFTDEGTVRLLDGAGIPLVRFADWESFAAVLRDIRLTGAAVGAEARAETLARSLERRIDAVVQRVRGRPRVRVLYYEIPGYTRGAGSLIDEMIERAGGHNVARDIGVSGAGELGFENVLALAPDVMILPDYGAGAAPPDALTRSPGWAQIPAVRAGRVHVVSAASITSVSQHAARGLEELARLIHPESSSSEPRADPPPAGSRLEPPSHDDPPSPGSPLSRSSSAIGAPMR